MAYATLESTVIADAVGPLEWIDWIVPVSDLDYPQGPSPSRALIASVRQIGVMSPVLLAGDPHGEPPYSVVDGLRRIAAAKEAGLTEIPARITPVTEEQRGILALIANQQRSRNPVAEVQAILRLFDDGHDESEIARLTGMPVQTIRKRIRIKQLIPELFTLYEGGDLPTALAEEAAKFTAAEQKETHRRWAEDGEKFTHALMHDIRSVRREAALEDLMPQIAPLPRRARTAAVVSRPGNGSLSQIFRELTDLLTKLPDAQSVLAASRLMGQLEAQIRLRQSKAA